MSGYHGGTEINIADRLGSLVSCGISVPFFNLYGLFYSKHNILTIILEA
jgi:hypothetical protein